MIDLVLLHESTIDWTVIDDSFSEPEPFHGGIIERAIFDDGIIGLANLADGMIELAIFDDRIIDLAIFGNGTIKTIPRIVHRTLSIGSKEMLLPLQFIQVVHD